MSSPPNPGDPVTFVNFNEFISAVEDRKEKYPDEPFVTTLGTVFFNLGDQYAPVRCVEGEWSGLKRDIPKTDGIPKCPNGHVLLEGPGVQLGWVAGE